ncbi:hypothetical protein HISP_17770 (plasmid) [Haloarcula hispanica N601]|uniref:Uncharacterized protein n=2 Tax=Haloarcula hispanica TaxID=51589 RepID=V5TRR1_HALHI|nr:hypothetical protein [Haloarcula hispanica]AEM58878.1 hypothetical protein HAH_4203 [Haloarcula hispanica ATCC 33960]AHB67986.1 hypothetical protein HISP_17770 [Haloarcula hispanica N601]
MAEILVFTLLAAVAAVYPVLPRYKQLRVRYNLWTKGRLLFIASLILLILLSYAVSVYLQSIEQKSIEVSYLMGSITITPLLVEYTQLGAVVGIVALFSVVFLKSNVRIQNEENLLEILRNLQSQENYSTLTNLIEDKYRPLVNHPPAPENPENLAASFKRAHREDYEPVEGWRKLAREKKRLVNYYLGRIGYRLKETAERSSEYTNALLLDSDFSKQYPSVATELGLRILRDDSLNGRPRKKVVHRYLRELLKVENSLLYRDLEQNTNQDGLYRYDLEEQNRLLYALFSDFNRAVELDVYKPVGDKTKEIIRDQRREEIDRYNDQRLTNTDISDEYIFSDPVFLGVQYFDVLVTEAFHQKIDWHVWLSYYESFTREICRNYEINEYSDPDAEWPNDYSRLLYEMISNMRDWIKMMDEYLKPDVDSGVSGPPYHLDVVPEDVDGTPSNSESHVDDAAGGEDDSDESDDEDKQEEYGDHVRLGRMSTGRGQRNIPEMTVIILFSCHEKILSTSEIPLQFKAYITKIVFMCLLDLREYEQGSLQWEYSEFMLYCLEDNLTGRASKASYREVLKQVYQGEYGGQSEYGVRHEVHVKDTQMTGLVDALDDII